MNKKKRARLRNRLPDNYSCWCYTLMKPNETEDFIKRGNKRQHDIMIHVLLYMQGHDSEMFEEIKGKDILKRLENV